MPSDVHIIDVEGPAQVPNDVRELLKWPSRFGLLLLLACAAVVLDRPGGPSVRLMEVSHTASLGRATTGPPPYEALHGPTTPRREAAARPPSAHVAPPTSGPLWEERESRGPQADSLQASPRRPAREGHAAAVGLWLCLAGVAAANGIAALFGWARARNVDPNRWRESRALCATGHRHAMTAVAALAAEEPAAGRSAAPEEAARIIRTCAPLLPGPPAEEQEFAVARLEVGNTNRLYCLSCRARPERYLVREYGAATALAFDRDAETDTFAELGRCGLAPRLVAKFPGGRIETWIDGTPCTVVAVREPAIYEDVARALVALHAFRVAPSPQAWGWQMAELWLHGAEKRIVEIEQRAEDRGYVQRVGALRGRLQATNELLVALRRDARAAAMPCCYCHNDLSNTNVHVLVHGAGAGAPGRGARLQLIDFEYGGWNYRGFDLATHLSHWAGGAVDGRYDDSRFPSEAEQGRFLAAYASAHAEPRPTVASLLEEVRFSAPLAHSVWGLWAVCSLPLAPPAQGFSHIEYAERRLCAAARAFARV